MSKKQRVQRPREDLERELNEQLALLRLACQSYDAGHEIVGRHISVSLRLLLNQRPPRQAALLAQLGMRDGRFWNTAPPINPRNLLPHMPMVAGHMHATGGRYAPVLGGVEDLARWTFFPEWWTETVLTDPQRNRFSRMDLVIMVANTDGGAHVDPELDEAYEALSRRNSLGWQFVNRGGAASAFEGRPELACIRQIAYEVLRTLDARLTA